MIEISISGKLSSGKTYFIQKILIPSLKDNNITYQYAEEHEILKIHPATQVAIIEKINNGLQGGKELRGNKK
jgi:hypothetical protein